MSASPNNPNMGFHWHPQPRNAPPSIFTPAGGAGHEALQALLAFSALHEQVRRQTQADSTPHHSGQIEQFVLDEVLQLVADRAIALTGANGVAIALEEGGEIICRASSGTIAPDKRAKLNPNSGFSGACFRTGQIIRCDDTETDERVNVQAARRLGTRSMVAVPLMGRDGTVGLIEAFSSKAYAFQDSNIRSLNLLAELILGAMKPEVQSQTAVAFPVMPLPVETAPVEIPAEQPSVMEAPATAPTIEAIREKVAPVSGEPIRLFEPQPDEPASGHQAWMKIALGILLVAVVLAGGMWWKLHKARTASSSSSSANTSELARQPESPAAVPNAPKAGSNGPAAVTGVRHWSSPTSSTVVVDLQDNVRYEEHRLSDPDRIYFDLPDTTLDHKLLGKTFEVGDTFLLRVRVAQPTPGTTRIVLDTRNNPDYKVRLNQDPYRLEVEVHSANAPAPPKTSFNLFTPSQPPAQSVVAPAHVVNTRTATLAVASPAERNLVTSVPKFVVALDAGHGGWDEGTIGRRGLMEKDLALDIVARLGKLVADRLGGEVIYTRRDDTYVPLEKRAEIANMAQADFFVSIHANYSETPSARGVETYYSNSYSSLNARIPGASDALKQVDWTNVDIKEKALQSEQLAASIQRALFARVAKGNPGIDDRGVKKASYVVLTGTTMPAILTEVSFVSSPADETRLKHSAYRQQIADAIYRGIARYVATQHKVTLASAGSKAAAR